ncbi:MAG: hypothetical protein GWN64_02320, partial [Candidatus Thorarchaeota archaeon]|nr:hypothetical protein [Candidatus Thorarchaeota archaeon]
DVEDFGKDEDLASTLEDICNHGIDGGFSGFIYYTDTVEFAKANMELIVEALKSDKDDFG